MTDIRARNWERYGKGEVKLNDDSGLRKRARAARRGKFELMEPTPKAVARHVHPRRLRFLAEARA